MSFRTRDNRNVEAIVDLTGTTVGITYSHDAVHRDVIVNATIHSAGVSGDRLFLIRTGTPLQMHLVYRVIADKIAVIRFYEGPTVTGVGTPITKSRLHRPSNKPIQAIVNSQPTVSDNGTLIQELSNGGGGTGAGVSGGDLVHEDAEWVLKVDTDYLLVVNVATSTALSVEFEWYEVPAFPVV